MPGLTVENYWISRTLCLSPEVKKIIFITTNEWSVRWPALVWIDSTRPTGWNYACAGAWPLSRKDVIAQNKMAPLLQYFVLMAIIVSIECRKDVFKCSVCGKNLSNLKAERRKFRAVSDDLFACFGPSRKNHPMNLVKSSCVVPAEEHWPISREPAKHFFT